MLSFYIWTQERGSENKVQPEEIQVLTKEKPKAFELLDIGDENTQPTVSVRGREIQVCRTSCFIFPIDGYIRQQVLSFVGWVWFDRFILSLICLNSICLAIYDYRSDEHAGFNGLYNDYLDRVLTVAFTLEFLFKVVAWGFVLNKNSYLRDDGPNYWNLLDFVVVVAALIDLLPVELPGFGWLRVFRALRPLRSLNAVPQMKVLVKTVISSVPRLANVTAVAGFLFLVFGIIGVTLMSGIFYHRCHADPAPVLSFINGTTDQCWSWPYAEDDRLCSGNYNCEASGGYCRGLDDDPTEELRPAYPGGSRNGLPWCPGSERTRLFPETDFIHFDNIGGALLIVFQCTTLEGWTDIMYMVQDGYSFWVATIYFFLMIPLTSFFILNVALAVVDEARADFDEEEEGEDNPDDPEGEDAGSKKFDDALMASMDMDMDEDAETDEEPWLYCGLVMVCRKIAFNEKFMNIIMICIIGNVITMCMERFPPAVEEQAVLSLLERIFLIVFCIEMFVLVMAMGPVKYATNPVTGFDGAIVFVSVAQEGMGSSGPFTALRTLRLFRVLNKLANRWPSFKVLLKAMVLTAISLNYWLVLFALVLYISTLMCQTFFAREFHFEDPDSFNKVSNPGEFWCPGTEGLDWHFRQDCIPRANFDTFLWAFVTIFQIMSGENWNTVMYAGMRAKGWPFAFIFALLILFGQTLFLSLFLSMLMAKFDKVQDSLDAIEQEHAEMAKMKKQKTASKNSLYEPGDEDEGDRPATPPEPTSKPSALVASYQEVKRFYKSITERETWPTGYAWFILHTDNPVRRGAQWLLDVEVELPKIGEKVKVFDNVILLCILISSVCMAVDSPLQDPTLVGIELIRGADQVFAIIFIIEMSVKLIALGLIWGEDAYLKSGWNILDSMVVAVSIVDMASETSVPGLKTLRIMRAFRPLRVISRNENLKVVVQTIFASLPHLLTLVIVALLFLLIFALFGLSYLNGRFNACDMETDVGLRSQLGLAFTTPLCIPENLSSADPVSGGYQRGHFELTNNTHSAWVGNETNCTSGYREFRRPTADTPICIGRCMPEGTYETVPPSWVCPQALTSADQLPAMCGPDVVRTKSAAELEGEDYIAAMTRTLVLPCGGSQVDQLTGEVSIQPVSCEALFCPDVSSAKRTQCEDNCEKDPFFCTVACRSGNKASAECQSCFHECVSACTCSDFCEPLTKDAALCLEQGSRWAPVIQQNFDNIGTAMLTLFEISTTEGWVDVMYAAADIQEHYEQPKREAQETLWSLGFTLYIFFSNMFIINLAVGVIVDQFMAMKTTDKSEALSAMQKDWVLSITSLYSRSVFVSLQDLHELSTLRRKIYSLVSSTPFEHGIMGAIVCNTAFMALKIFPAPDQNLYPGDGWDLFLEVLNYVFATIFTIECLLKLFALRLNYFRDSWNLFDFCCVVATLAGILISALSSVNIAAITSVIRIFRIARLFRLLRFLKGLNKIFMALLISLPKLINVLLILILLLILYSILGVSLFSTAKTGDTLNEHGNFRDFRAAFITLFRASTGEAWNEIMHDMWKSEADFYRAGDWCAPDTIYDFENKYEVLKDKCLIDIPNGCVQTIFGHNIWPVIFWVSYTLLISFMVMNLLIAVILEGYEDGKDSPASEVVEICVKVWLRYDSDQRMSLPMGTSLVFINEALQEIEGDRSEDNKGAEGPAAIPMKYVAALDVKVFKAPDGDRVHFISAVRQVMRYHCLGDDLASLELLDQVKDHMEKKDAAKLSRLEEKAMVRVEKEVSKQPPRTSPASVAPAPEPGAAGLYDEGFRDQKEQADLGEHTVHSETGVTEPGMSSREPQAQDLEPDEDSTPVSPSPPRKAG